MRPPEDGSKTFLVSTETAEGKALEAMGQGGWTGYQAGLAAFSLDVQGGVALMALDPSRG